MEEEQKDKVSQKNVTTKTLNKIRDYLQSRDSAFSIGHISETLNIHFYYAAAAIMELLKTKEIREIPTTNHGRLFIKNG